MQKSLLADNFLIFCEMKNSFSHSKTFSFFISFRFKKSLFSLHAKSSITNKKKHVFDMKIYLGDRRDREKEEKERHQKMCINRCKKFPLDALKKILHYYYPVSKVKIGRTPTDGESTPTVGDNLRLI
jgi:hypothetical protein